MKKTVIIIICICFISILILCYMSSIKGPVHNKQEAIKIAQDYVKEIYGNEFPDYKIGTDLEKNTWIVYYYLDEEQGGGGPAVYINKSNGKVINSYLQK